MSPSCSYYKQVSLYDFHYSIPFLPQHAYLLLLLSTQSVDVNKPQIHAHV